MRLHAMIYYLLYWSTFNLEHAKIGIFPHEGKHFSVVYRLKTCSDQILSYDNV